MTIASMLHATGMVVTLGVSDNCAKGLIVVAHRAILTAKTLW